MNVSTSKLSLASRRLLCFSRMSRLTRGEAEPSINWCPHMSQLVPPHAPTSSSSAPRLHSTLPLTSTLCPQPFPHDSSKYWTFFLRNILASCKRLETLILSHKNSPRRIPNIIPHCSHFWLVHVDFKQIFCHQSER